MFEQLTQLVQQYGNDAVVKNQSIPNEQNEGVMNEASSSILSGLQNMLAEGKTEDLASLFQGNNASDASNPVVQKLTDQFSGNLGSKLGIDGASASGVAASLIPTVLGALFGNAKDPNHKGFEISDIINAISGGNGNSGLMDAISKYGTQFGLDQNADGKVDMTDVIDVVSSKEGIGGLMVKLFGKS